MYRKKMICSMLENAKCRELQGQRQQNTLTFTHQLLPWQKYNTSKYSHCAQEAHWLLKLDLSCTEIILLIIKTGNHFSSTIKRYFFLLFTFVGVMVVVLFLLVLEFRLVGTFFYFFCLNSGKRFLFPHLQLKKSIFELGTSFWHCITISLYCPQRQA